MLIPEEFERCPQCDSGWFEKKEFIMTYKGSSQTEKPDIYKKEIQYQCVGCGYIMHKHEEQL